jgi:hypothetical protein
MWNPVGVRRALVGTVTQGAVIQGYVVEPRCGSPA